MEKGQHYYVIGLVTLGLLLLVSIPLFGSVKDKSGDVLSHSICMDSVSINSRFSLAEDEYKNRIKCPTVFEKRGVRSKQEAMQVLANRMVMMWDEFQQGKPELFDRSLLETENYCIFRFVEEFENADKIGPISADEFTAYLWSERVKRNGREIPVIEYLSGYSSDELRTINVNEFSDVSLDTTKPLAIAITYSKGSAMNTVFGTWVLAGAAIGFVAATVLSGGTVLIVTGTVALGTAGGVIAIETNQGAEHTTAIMIVPWDTDALEELNCTYLPGDQTMTGAG